ncbi:uncharacterized protein [Oryza sativa Japonica Group]|uniref:uncharacterized protein n=1 Tax=Oryza sativa subsp. japonica TaxID=39947 RepID=UPI00339CC995
MRQFGKKQDWPVEDISTGVELHKYDRVRTKKVKDWGLEHNRYIDEWRTAERNDRYIETIHQNHLFSEYLRWLHRTYRLFLRPTWTEADIEDDRDFDEGRNPYDIRTRVGYQMEHAPLRDRVSRELLRSVNEMGHALQAPRGGEDTENTLRNVLEKVRQRCRKLAARLGCKSVGLDDVYQPRRLPPPLPHSARPSTARHSIRTEEREEVGGSSSSRIPQGRGKGKAPYSHDTGRSGGDSGAAAGRPRAQQRARAAATDGAVEEGVGGSAEEMGIGTGKEEMVVIAGERGHWRGRGKPRPGHGSGGGAAAAEGGYRRATSTNRTRTSVVDSLHKNSTTPAARDPDGRNEVLGVVAEIQERHSAPPPPYGRRRLSPAASVASPHTAPPPPPRASSLTSSSPGSTPVTSGTASMSV